MEIKKIEKSDFVMFFDERSGKAERPRMQHRGLEFRHVERDAFKAELRHDEGQGDNSNAALLVVNPVVEMHLARQWSITLSGSYFARRTHYNYYYDKDFILRQNSTVHANTFETKIGLTCRL